jgi:cellulose synthase (UDP-forming)
MPSESLTSHTPGSAAHDARTTQSARNVKYESLGLARSILVVVYLVVAIWYLAYRPSTFNPQAMAFSIIVYAAEIFGFVVSLMHIFMVRRLTVRTAPLAPTGLSVDIFVPTYNEPLDMLRRTLLAALRVDYPHRTWLLDDGNRPEVRALAEALGCRYLARTENTDAKAGNLNNALKHSDAEFVAIFDADHAPARDFLRRTLGYFEDPKVAFVQTPQDFYNLDSYQHRHHPHRRLVWTEQSLFFRVIQRGKDYWNAAFFCGSCAVMRRRALEEVKGFATGTVTEDLQTSIRLHRKGFDSVYHTESLAFGVAPATIGPFLKQRVRWGQGAMQALRGGGILFGSGLSAAQRVNYLATVLTYFDGWQKAVFYLAPVVVLFTGIMPIADMTWIFLAHFIPFYILTFWVFEEVGRGYGRSIAIEQYNMARFAAFVWATLGLIRRKIPFNVTAKHRMEQEHPRRWVAPQTAVFLLNVVAIPVGIFFTWMRGGLPTGALIANIVWACVNFSLARSVLGFTARLSGFRRRDYRFPVPLPALLEFSDEAPVVGVLDDISTHGFKFYGRFPAATAVGTQVHGEIYLPSGKLPFKALVRALIHSDPSPASHIKALGCSFQWDVEADRDELVAFLYGSNLQWRMNQLGEQMRTPLEWMSAESRWRRRQPGAKPERWASVLSRSTASLFATPDVGLVSVPINPSGDRTLVSFRRLADVAPLHLDVVTRSGVHALEGPAYFVDSISTATTPLHLYRFETRDRKEAPKDAAWQARS